ncbi:hypothetical protein [uncultured Algimonas sp.]|uniref:hypothetical protein n=1 Tax=uncultured Algimonas sp. TaxID=1547920 RepID=UPI002632C55E|nr:hypothetical protein [uncultured Algimonas sp.]
MAAVTICIAAIAPAYAQDPSDAPPADADFMPDPRTEAPLDEEALRAAFSGQTHLGTYNFKRPEIDTFSFRETTSANGTTRHYHGDKIDTGTWRIMSNVICFTYDNWNGGIHRACFNIFQRGNCYYHYALNQNGNFTARSVHAGETPDCEPAMV